MEFLGGKVRLLAGDCREVIATLSDASVDSVVTDPPYALTSMARPRPDLEGKNNQFARRQAQMTGFMGKQWDTGEVAFDPEFWTAVLRVLKPGGHLVAFSGTRTYHRMVCAIEDAGFEIRDQLAWVFGSGFPKSHNAGNGWGTALKPAYEPVVLAQKPYTSQAFLATLVPTIGELICKVASLGKTDTSLSEPLRTSGFLSTVPLLSECLAVLSERGSTFTTGTAIALIIDLKILRSSLLRIIRAITTGDHNLTSGVASDALLAADISRSVSAKCERLAFTTAGEIAIDWLAEEGSDPAGADIRPAWEPIVLARKPLIGTVAENVLAHGTGAINIDGTRVAGEPTTRLNRAEMGYHGGNLASEYSTGSNTGRWPANLVHDGSEEVLAGFPESRAAYGNQETADKNRGKPYNAVNYIYGASNERVQGNNFSDTGSAARFFYSAKADSDDRIGSRHPTVKPIDLMRWLCRLITPPGGTILDPFAGTGTTGEAAFYEGFMAILIEREAEYIADIERRMKLVMAGPDERAREAIKARMNGKPRDDGPLFAGLDNAIS